MKITNKKINKLYNGLAISVAILGLISFIALSPAVYAKHGGAHNPGTPDNVCNFDQKTGAYTSCSDCGNPDANAGNCRIYEYLDDFVNLLSAAVGVIAVAMVVYGGIEFSSSGGDPQKVASGKKHITNALIAVVAFLFLWAFLNFIIPGGVFNGQS